MRKLIIGLFFLMCTFHSAHASPSLRFDGPKPGTVVKRGDTIEVKIKCEELGKVMLKAQDDEFKFTMPEDKPCPVSTAKVKVSEYIQGDTFTLTILGNGKDGASLADFLELKLDPKFKVKSYMDATGMHVPGKY